MKLTRTGKPILPFLDPEYDPNHPANSLPPIIEDPYAPLTKAERMRRERSALESALAGYTPTHVLRTWEVDSYRTQRRHDVLRLQLSSGDYFPDGSPSPILLSRLLFETRYNIHDSSASRRTESPYDPIEDPDKNDFRQFAVHELHLGYHRFHPSTHHDPSNSGSFSELEIDPPDLTPTEICWIMEYTIHECTIIRRQLAKILGIYPAAADPDTKIFDPRIESLYYRRLHARCRRFSRRCIRPSHIELYAPSGEMLP